MTLENTNKVWIFHHNDADGYAAAAILGSKYYRLEYKKDEPSRIVYNENVEFIAVDYDKPIDFSQVKKEDEVWILDYSLGRKDDQTAINKMYAEFGTDFKFTWIDHHKTALVSISECRGLRGFLEKRGGVFVTEEFEQAGCALMWIFMQLGGNSSFNASYHQSRCKCHISATLNAFKSIMKSAPDWVKWTADHDIFSGLYEESHEFSAGVYHKGLKEVYLDLDNPNSYIYLLSCEDMKKHLVDEDDFNLNLNMINAAVYSVTNDIYRLGKEVTDIRNRIYERNLHNAFDIFVTIKVSKDFIDPNNDMKFEYDEHGITNYSANIICLNGFGNSEAFLDKYEEYDAVILFGYDGETVYHSIYSKKSSTFPCNLLALWGRKTFDISGGGHDHAAGFYTDYLIFFKDTYYLLTNQGITEYHKIEKTK